MFRYLVAGRRQAVVLVDGDQMLTTQQAAALAGRSDECIRQWVRESGIGVFDETLNRYFISRRRLEKYLIERHGEINLPHALKAG